MLMPRFTTSNNDRTKSAGIFVQCDPEGEGASWSCQAHARITLKNHKGDDFTRSKRNSVSFIFKVMNGYLWLFNSYHVNLWKI